MHFSRVPVEFAPNDSRHGGHFVIALIGHPGPPEIGSRLGIVEKATRSPDGTR
jgi:hypothetical protein